MTSLLEPGPGGPESGKMPFCRMEELHTLLNAIDDNDALLVLIAAHSGFGGSALVGALAEHATNAGIPMLFLQGNPSLAAVPYGVLTPYWHDSKKTGAEGRLHVLGAVLRALNQHRAAFSPARTAPPGGLEAARQSALIIIDDVHVFDEATIEILVILVMSGVANVVATHKKSEPVPAALLELWNNGMAERLELQPLTPEQGHLLCESILGGTVHPSTSWSLWSSTGGNPGQLHLLVREAVELGYIQASAGTWVLIEKAHTCNPELVQAVQRRLLGLSKAGRRALDLVALAGPIASSTVSNIVGVDAVEELLEGRLIHERPDEPKLLRLLIPMYAEVIRELVPRVQNVVLYEQLAASKNSDTITPENTLRRVCWMIDSGLAVDDEMTLRAAVYACRLFQNNQALWLAKKIHSHEFAMRVRGVTARVRFNLGDYATAVELLGDGDAGIQTLEEAMFASLLRPANKLASGLVAVSAGENATALRTAGARLESICPERSDTIGVQITERARLLDILELSLTGDYELMGSLIRESLHVPVRPDDPDYVINRVLVLAMEAERLTACGRPVQGQRRAAQAFITDHADDQDVYFLLESITFRQLEASVYAGDWAATTKMIQTVAMEVGPAASVFSSSVKMIRGLVAVRQGRYGDALEVLMPTLQAFTTGDPLQLDGLCVSLAFYAAAAEGDVDLAQQLHAKCKHMTGTYLAVAHAQAYLAAGMELLDRDGFGLSDLLRQANVAAKGKAVMLELNALMLAVSLGAHQLLDRLVGVAGQVEGRWAAAIETWALAQLAGDVSSFVRAGDLLLDTHLFQLAEDSYARAAAGLENSAEDVTVMRIRVGLEKARVRSPRHAQRSLPSILPNVETPVLSRRERQIATLVISGHTDRAIAGILKVSVRTVEGHLHKAYAKLGVKGRQGLIAITVDIPPGGHSR